MREDNRELGALLRSGKSQSFTALGETGRPVYRAALQLREAIRRKGEHFAEHLAIPQSDELGDQIDWYSKLPGDVVPWGSATEEEKAPARAQLEALKNFLLELGSQYLNADIPGSTGDRMIFGKLLAHVIRFPDENFVYLVNGKPVLTSGAFSIPMPIGTLSRCTACTQVRQPAALLSQVQRLRLVLRLPQPILLRVLCRRVHGGAVYGGCYRFYYCLSCCCYCCVPVLPM